MADVRNFKVLCNDRLPDKIVVDGQELPIQYALRRICEHSKAVATEVVWSAGNYYAEECRFPVQTCDKTTTGISLRWQHYYAGSVSLEATAAHLTRHQSTKVWDIEGRLEKTLRDLGVIVKDIKGNGITFYEADVPFADGGSQGIERKQLGHADHNSGRVSWEAEGARWKDKNVGAATLIEAHARLAPISAELETIY